MVFGLWTALGGHGAPGIELAHNVASLEEVGAVLAEAERAGGTVLRPAARAEWGGTSGAFADPDGYVWEIAQECVLAAPSCGKNASATGPGGCPTTVPLVKDFDAALDLACTRAIGRTGGEDGLGN